MAFIKETGRTVDGKQYRYQHLVRSYKDEDGVTRHEYLLNLSDVPEEIVQILRDGLDDNKSTVELDDLQTGVGDALRGAGQMALWRAWDKAQMDRLLRDFSDKQINSIKTMVFSRISSPCSKRAIKEVMADTFLSKRYTKNRLEEDTLYEVMDEIAENFYEVQQALNDVHQNQDPRLLLYDTTSTYFEGTCADDGEYGHSKDKRWDRYQIIIGVVTNQDGLPLAVEVWRGNKHDADTIDERIQLLQEQFGFEEVTFVSDSGTYGTENIQTITEAGFDYITSMAWRAQKKRLTDLAPKQMKLFDQRGFYEWEEGETRYIGCQSEAEKQRAQNRRLEAMKKARDELDRLQETAASGSYYTKLRLYEKVQTILKEKGVKELFTVSIEPLKEGADEEEKCPQKLEYDLDLIALRKRRALEGKYILQTSLSEQRADPEQVETDYKQLQEVERGFRHIKSYLKIRPIYHRRGRRVRAHVLICFLAYFLVKWMEKRLREAGIGEEVERVIRRWDQLKLAKNRLQINDYKKEEYVWCRGEVGDAIVEEIREVGWWKSIQGYKRGITKSLKEKG